MIKEELEETFTDVRKAYRLLYHYQRRVLDLIQGISQQLRYEYRGGRPHYMKPSPNNDGGKLDQSAWDWLNMYFYEFKMIPRQNGKKKLCLSIFIQSDSGPFETDKPIEELSAFSNVETSSTRLHFLFFDKKLDDVIGDFINDGDIPAKDNNYRTEEHNGGTFLIKAFELSDFVNEDKVIEIANEISAKVEEVYELNLKALENN